MPRPVSFALILILTAVLAPSKEASAVTLYMAPDGNDAWSGRLERPNAAGTDGPLASLLGARDAVRQARQERVPDGPVRVVIADGTYPAVETVTFGGLDSGAEDSPIIYEAAPGARPVFSGGRAITGFEPGEDGVWQAHVPEVAAGEWYFEQLWVNGRRATRARLPNEFYYYTPEAVEHGLDPDTGEPVVISSRAFSVDPADIAPLLDIPEDRLSDVTIQAYHSWETSRHRLAHVDADANLLFLTGPARWRFNRWGPRQRYHLENFRAALDSPGEWFLDRDGTLYYMPLPDEDMTAAEVIAPAGVQQFVEFAGEPDLGLPVEHITLRGLSFRHGRYILPERGHSDGQAAVSIPAAIMADGARNVVIDACEVAHVGTYGIWFRRACRDSRVTQTLLRDLGAGGMRIGEGITRAELILPQDQTSRITFHNNIVHGGGRLFPGAVGVWIGQSGSNVVTHNDISDLFYTGISVGWTWGYRPTISQGNTVDFNHIHHIGWGVLSDMGGVYTLGDSEDTTVNNNVIHHVYSYDRYGRGGWGLYNDEGTTRITMENNLVYNTKTGSYHQHYGRENMIRNNILVNSMEGQVGCSRLEDHISLFLEGNIIYWEDGPLFTRPDMHEKIISRRNLYWKASDEPVRFYDYTLEQWQALGMDEGSIIADPLFVDPDDYDFRLRPGSPAARIGLVEFDHSRAGLVGDQDWVSLPQTFEFPQVRFAPPPPPVPPLTIRDDFEASPAGAPPARARVHVEGRGDSIAVTDEHAATGRHSLRIVDAPGLERDYNPHFYYQPNHTRGVTRGAFHMRVEQDVRMFHEWRTYGDGPFRVGPAFRIENGVLRVAGEDLMRLPVGEWFHVEIIARVGQDADGTWRFTLTLPGEEPLVLDALPVRHADFTNLDWVGWSSNATDTRVFYLDDIELHNTPLE